MCCCMQCPGFSAEALFLAEALVWFMQVLDMCAAPGSKTAQILEMLHAGTMIPEGEQLVCAAFG